MPRPKSPVPSYSLHKPSGQAYVRVPDEAGGRTAVYLGKHGSPESQAEYRRVLAELQARPPSPAPTVGPRPGSLTVSELLLAFFKWALTHYRTPDGKPTTEVNELKRSLKPVRELYGHTPAAEFGPKALAAVRQQMVGAGWCRTLVNRRVERVKRVFRWAASEELVSVAVYQALKTLAGLKKGRTEARESEAVKPVDPAVVKASLPFLTPHLAAMVELQRLTGMRPGEACRLRLSEVDRSGEVWVYRPARHKTAHRGKPRVVHIGPRAQAVVAAFLRGSAPDGFAGIDLSDETARLVAADAYQEAGRERDALLLRDLARPVVLVAGCVVDPSVTLFSPARARDERFREARKNRRSKVPPSQQNRRKAQPRLVPAAEYNPHTYAHAVRRAAEKAGVPHWHPNQLRHLFATEVRRVHGLEAAQVLLGHATADVTQVYAERDQALAAAVAAQIG